MTWLWQLPNWPKFTWNADELAALEADFLKQSGRLAGSWRHLEETDQLALQIDWLSEEAIQTSAIEGEVLNRASVQSSVRRQFGLTSDHRRSGPAEAGIAEMMVDVYRHYAAPLSEALLCEWHSMIMNGRRDLNVIGGWRTHSEPMQVVSGVYHKPKVHYQAPPSEDMGQEMQRFIDWFNASQGLPALTRAGLAHFYFVCVHPFEDGNGRIGRAISEKALAQNLDRPSLISLSHVIFKHRSAYYQALQAANHQLDVTAWLKHFGQTILDAQLYSEARLVRLIDKARMFDRLRRQLNERQEKALLRLFEAEPEGFAGGLSSANYRKMTGATVPTATRDLADLVAKGALRKQGELKHTRYYLDLPPIET